MNKKFSDGIKYYTEAVITKKVFFPEDEVKCQYCEFCRAEKELGRYWCRLTSRMIYEPFSLSIPDFCALQINRKDEE